MGKSKLVTGVVSVDNLKELGFEVKLTKDDLFDLVLEEMMQKSQARLSQIAVSGEQLSKDMSSLKDKALSNAELLLKQNAVYLAYVAEFPLACVAKKSLSDSSYWLGMRLGGEYAYEVAPSKSKQAEELYTNFLIIDSEKHCTSGLRLSFKVDAAVVSEYNALAAQSKALTEEATATKQELHSLEHSPRKVKMAMLKTMLAGTDVGKNLLKVVQSVNKSLAETSTVK